MTMSLRRTHLRVDVLDVAAFGRPYRIAQPFDAASLRRAAGPFPLLAPVERLRFRVLAAQDARALAPDPP